MKLIQEIQHAVEEQARLKEEATKEILQWLEEENAKPSIGILDEISRPGISQPGQVAMASPATGGVSASRARAGEDEWVRDMAQDVQEPLAEPAAKPVFLMGQQLPPKHVKLDLERGMARVFNPKTRKWVSYQADDMGDKIDLR